MQKAKTEKPKRRQPGARRTGKAATGIAGLDAATHGGIPRGRTTIVFGGPGAGKTVLGLQTLVNGVRLWNEPGIFVAFEESSERILSNAASFGWEIGELSPDRLFFFDAKLRPDVVRVGNFDVSAFLAGLGAKVKAIAAKRVVLDGIDVLLGLLDDPAAERVELHRILDWILRNELTGIITAKAEGADPFMQARYGYAAYMAECAILLTRRHQDVVSERDLSVLKYRGSAFSENRAPFVIGATGIEVAEQGSTKGSISASKERVRTGIPRLDTMLSGGYFRASTTLITGLPGTAKSTLSGAFVAAACKRKERCLYVTFDEHGVETVRNLESVGIRVGPFVAAGRLKIVSALSLSDSAETQLMRVRDDVRQQRATCVVIDPISALGKSSDRAMALAVLARFIHWTKEQRITLVCTSLLSGTDPYNEATDLGVSTLCDSWIHLSYAQRGGERNRALTIIKSRGTKHSNQVRELVLSDAGVTLADVYQTGGEVFMGTLRWEQENADRDAQLRMQTDAQKRRLELERSQADMRARSDALARDLALIALELGEGERVERERVARDAKRRSELLSQRWADADARTTHRAGRGRTNRGAA